MRHTNLLLAIAMCGTLYAAADHAQSADSAPVSDGNAATKEAAAQRQEANADKRHELSEADRRELEVMAKNSLDQVLAKNGSARKKYEASRLYAAFRTTKVGALITGAGGSGVAVDPETNKCVYMHMGAGGVAAGGGIERSRLVFLFADQDTFNRFVDGSWDGSATAQAVAGKASTEAASNFADSTSVYQITDKGLIAQADVTMMRFWKDHDSPMGTDSSALRCAS